VLYPLSYGGSGGDDPTGAAYGDENGRGPLPVCPIRLLEVVQEPGRHADTLAA
jgi:hypothetical protein